MVATNTAADAADTVTTAVDDTMTAPLQQDAQALQLSFADWSNLPTADSTGASFAPSPLACA